MKNYISKDKINNINITIEKTDYQKINDMLDNLTQDELYSLTTYILNKKMSDKTFENFKNEWFG